MSATAPPAPATDPGDDREGGLLGHLSRLPISRLGNLRDYGVLLILIGFCVYLTASTGNFLTKQNLLNLVDQSTSTGIIACAGTLVLIAGGFDLSVGAIYAFVGVLTAKVGVSVDPVLALVIGLAGGLACGLFNGVLVSRGRINPFVVTLASGIIFGGIAVAMANGVTYPASWSLFHSIAQDKFLGVLWSSWIFGIFALAMGFILQRTVLGRHIYAVGGNREAARLSGVKVDLVITIAFALSGLAAALAGILYLAKVGSAQPDVGGELALGAVAAIVVGGTSITGGEGAIYRTVVGVFFLGLIGNGFNLLGWNPLYEQIIEGSIILAAVGVDVWVKRR